MDLIIALAGLIAFVALAYVTYRNVYNLDGRLRKIEDILKNAQVVAEPVHHAPVPAPVPVQSINGWGGQDSAGLPKVTVTKEDEERSESEGNQADDERESVSDSDSDAGTDDKVKDGEDKDSVNLEDLLNEMENDADSPDMTHVKVTELRAALKSANVPAPAGLKKKDLIQLVKDNDVKVPQSDAP